MLSVTGATQSTVNGHYQLDESFGRQCSSHPVWTKTSASAADRNVTVYVYYLADGFYGWIFS